MILTVDRAAIASASQVLRSYTGPQMEKRLQRATLASVNALKGPLRAATPRAKGHVPTRYPRDLAGSIRVRRTKKRGVFLGYTVGPGGKLGFHRWWVVGGTKPHIILGKRGKPLGLPFGPRAMVRHPGARANPYVERVGRESEGLAIAAFLRYLTK